MMAKHHKRNQKVSSVHNFGIDRGKVGNERMVAKKTALFDHSTTRQIGTLAKLTKKGMLVH